jgi:hypothetical protein
VDHDAAAAMEAAGLYEDEPVKFDRFGDSIRLRRNPESKYAVPPRLINSDTVSLKCYGASLGIPAVASKACEIDVHVVDNECILFTVPSLDELELRPVNRAVSG